MGAAAERAGQAFDPATFKHEGHALCECHAEGYPWVEGQLWNSESTIRDTTIPIEYRSRISVYRKAGGGRLNSVPTSSPDKN